MDQRLTEMGPPLNQFASFKDNNMSSYALKLHAVTDIVPFKEP